MSNIIVLGAGVMGSAFAQLLADAGNEVCLVGTHLDQDIIDSVLTAGTHPILKVKLPKSVRAFSCNQLEDIVDNRVRLIVFGVNSAGVDWAVERIRPLLKTPVPILMLTKGLAGRNGRMGKLLGSGMLYREAKTRHMPDDTIEGAELAWVIGETLSQLAENEAKVREALP